MKAGFPWAVRCSGFVILFFAIVINILLRRRLPPRKAGPIVEWTAFREPAHVLFAISMFLVFWALYFGFFYVSPSEKSCWHLIFKSVLILSARSTPTPAMSSGSPISNPYISLSSPTPSVSPSDLFSATPPTAGSVPSTPSSPLPSSLA